MVQRSTVTDCKPNLSPLPLVHSLYKDRKPLSDADRLEVQDKPDRLVLRALLYLATRTRPEVELAISMLSKVYSDSGPSHWKMLKHVVRYVAGTVDHGIHIPRGDGQVDLTSGLV